MWRARLVVLVFVTFGVVLFACRAFDTVPSRASICEADDLVTGVVPERTACTECIENTPCCDQVGSCAADPNCTKAIPDLLACVLGEGTIKAAENEARCLEKVDDGTPGRGLYDCMRTNCGAQCSLPVCKLDPSVPFVGNTACDRCFGLSCCNEFNACENNRLCKLTLDCIVETCQSELERTLSIDVVGAVREIERRACDPTTNEALPPPQSNPNCTNRCIDTYIRTGESLPELKEAACLALRVQTCGAAANCGPKCTLVGDAGGDAP